MKQPSGSIESDEGESSPNTAPEPFNLFAGLAEEQLPSAQSHVQSAARPETPLAKVSDPPAGTTRNPALAWTIVIATMIIIIIVAILL